MVRSMEMVGLLGFWMIVLVVIWCLSIEVGWVVVLLVITCAVSPRIYLLFSFEAGVSYLEHGNGVCGVSNVALVTMARRVHGQSYELIGS